MPVGQAGARADGERTTARLSRNAGNLIKHHGTLVQIDGHFGTGRELRLLRLKSENQIVVDLRPRRTNPFRHTFDNQRWCLIGERHPYADYVPQPDCALELQRVSERCSRVPKLVSGLAYSDNLRRRWRFGSGVAVLGIAFAARSTLARRNRAGGRRCRMTVPF